MQELEKDGIHLTSLSGYYYVHHLFDASLAILDSLAKTVEERVDDTSKNSVVLDSRISVLEHQFSSFQSQNDLDFAIQQELNDWNENRAMERYIVVTGLAQAPQKMSGGSLLIPSLLPKDYS